MVSSHMMRRQQNGHYGQSQFFEVLPEQTETEILLIPVLASCTVNWQISDQILHLKFQSMGIQKKRLESCDNDNQTY